MTSPPPCRLAGPGRQAGFTLFELLVAVLLLAMVSTMILSVLRVSITFADKGEDKLQQLAREQGLLELIGRQVNDAWYDAQRRQLRAGGERDMLQIFTRFPLLYREAGLVLAIYRYDESSKTLYYTEKRDFYNADYADDFAPAFSDMAVLAKLNAPLGLAYDPDTDVFTVSLGESRYEFLPRCRSYEKSTEKGGVL